MAATVHVLHAKPPAIGSFLRVGHTGHRKLESLIATSRMRFRRFVFDAAHIDEQRDLLATLRRSGCEIVLDPNVAETATPGRFASRLKFGNDDITKVVVETKKRLINLRDPLGDLHAGLASATRSKAPHFRGENQISQSVAG